MADQTYISKREAELIADPINFSPVNEEEFALALAVPMWRISHLYKIMIKGDDEDEDEDVAEDLVQTFVPNEAQMHFINSYHFRSIILKARQLGFTTFAAVYYLDCVLFRNNVRAGIIAQTDAIAKKLFRDKVKFAYENLPQMLLEAMPVKRDSADELLFAHNNSSIWVSTSMRGGTLQYLHISEFGKICAQYPARALEVITGAFPAVPNNGIIIVESTAEGREGFFYHMVIRALRYQREGIKLKNKQFKLLFYPWHQNAQYRAEPSGVIISREDNEYFDKVEVEIGKAIDIEQRAWYVLTRDEEFSGDEELMFREYPSLPEEPFSVSIKGTYYEKQLTVARKQKRFIKHIPVAPGVPCMTFWDIGNSDGTAIWVVQRIGTEFRCVRFCEGWGEPYSHFVKWLQDLGLVFGTHFLPHDADHNRQGQTSNKSPKEMLEELMPGNRFEIVPRIDDINWGIQQTRDVFPMLLFDETECKDGITHIQLYKKKWNENQQVWSDKPDKSHGHSEAADALRQLGQAYHNGQLNLSVKSTTKRRSRNWKTA